MAAAGGRSSGAAEHTAEHATSGSAIEHAADLQLVAVADPGPVEPSTIHASGTEHDAAPAAAPAASGPMDPAAKWQVKFPLVRPAARNICGDSPAIPQRAGHR